MHSNKEIIKKKIKESFHNTREHFNHDDGGGDDDEPNDDDEVGDNVVVTVNTATNNCNH